MTAYDSFFAAIVEGNLPATIPVASATADGIATATFDLSENNDARAGASSDDWRTRAAIAVYACSAAREGIDSETELHSA